MKHKAIVAYTLTVPVAIALAFALVTIAFNATENWPWRTMPGWTVLALNYVPPLVAGALTAAVLGWVAIRRRWYVPSVAAHLRRLALAYVLAGAIASVVFASRASSDYGLWRQSIEWPLAALIGIIMVDLILTLAKRRHLGPAT